MIFREEKESDSRLLRELSPYMRISTGADVYVCERTRARL